MNESSEKANPAPVERLRGGWLWLARTLLAAIPVFGIFFSFQVASYFGYAMWSEQAALIVLGLGLGATFLLKPARAGRQIVSGRPPLPDLLMSLLALGTCFWTAARYEHLVAIGYLGAGADRYLNMGVALLTIVLVLEALRRLTGWAMVILVLACIGYALVAQDMPGAFQGQTPPTDFLLGYLHLDAGGIVGTPLSVVVSTVIAYVLLGNALFRLGGGQMFLDLALAAMGRFRGGPAKSAALASSMFGSISGSAVANVATTGIVTIPLMKQTGYRSSEAGAIEAVASTGGQLLPPIMGAAAFIMAEFLGIPYAEVALAALLPALLFYVALMAQIHLHAARNDLRPLTQEERPRARETLGRYWLFLLPIALLMVLLFVLRWQPEQAALASLVAVIAAAALVRERSVGPRALFDILQGAGQSLLAIIAITAAAGIIVGVLSVTGLSFSLGLSIADVAGSTLIVLLLITALTAIVFGMGMPTTAVYVLMATLIAPALVAAGIEPLGAHLFVLYYGVLSMITPPVCLASFTAAAMAGAPFMRTGWQSLRFGLVAFIVPFMFVASPALLLQAGDWSQSAWALLTGLVGCVVFAAAVEGYLFGILNWALRAVAAVAGIMLIIPEGGPKIFFSGVPTDRIGIALTALIVATVWWQSRRSSKSAIGKPGVDAGRSVH
jgi:TRAP transporter 4TM/12TM fusion protein